MGHEVPNVNDVPAITPARESENEPRPLVLVVEDDDQVREYYVECLRARFDVDTCADGMAALAYFDRGRPDAILLDLNLPRLHGWTLYNELRRQPLTARTPVVVVTGADEVPGMPGAVVLRKPCGADALIEALECALAAEAPS